MAELAACQIRKYINTHLIIMEYCQGITSSPHRFKYHQITPKICIICEYKQWGRVLTWEELVGLTGQSLLSTLSTYMGLGRVQSCAAASKMIF